MLVGSMIGDIIEQELHAARMNIGEQGIEVCQRAEDRIDVGIIADVVTEIRHRRRINRRDPDGVDAEPLKIIEPAPYAAEIADRSEEHTSELQSPCNLVCR